MKKVPFLLILILLSFDGIVTVKAQIKPEIHFTEDNGLPGNVVQDVIKDKNGFLWVATNNGLSKFDGDTFVNITQKDGLSLPMVWALACGKENEIFAGLYKTGLAIIRNDSVIRILKSQDPHQNLIRKLYYNDFYQKLFIGTDYGVNILKDSIFLPVTLPEITHDKSSVLSITGRDSLIFFSIEGSLNQGLHKIIYNEPAPGRSYAARISRNGNYSSCLVGDTLYGGSFNKIFLTCDN